MTGKRAGRLLISPPRAGKQRRRMSTDRTALPSWTWRLAALVLAVLGVAYGAALVLLTRAPAKAMLRARIEAALRARLGDLQLGDEVRIDPLFRVTVGPLSVPGPRRGDPPLLVVERIAFRPRFGALLLGRAEPASIRLERVRVAIPGDPQALRDLVNGNGRTAPRRAAGAQQSPAPATDERPERRQADPPIHVRDLVVALHAAGHEVQVGPAKLSVRRTRDDAAERTTAELELPGRGRGRLELHRDAGGWRGEARLEGLGPEALPSGLLPVTLTGGTLALSIAAEAPPDLSRAEGRVTIQAAELFVGGEMLAAAPVGPISGGLEAVATWNGAERRLAIRDGRLGLLGAITVALEGEARLGAGIPFTLRAHADGVDFRAAVGALPGPLAPPPAAPRPAGTLDARISVSGPLLAPGAWSVEAGLDLSRLREAARRAPPVSLRSPFLHHPQVERGRPATVAVGPGNPDFVPVAELPIHVTRAVTASEDAGFFAHSGFDFEELRNALEQGAEAGRVVRGGSTITQQIAKNLFLSREKTLARKVREAAITIALEATVPKPRLLEIYLNIAEWGPGVWGIGPAARHWFGKDARLLTPKEAAFLATVIPNPVRYHFMWNRGTVSDAWEQRVHELLLTMTEQGTLSEDELVAALDQPIVFARPDAVAQPAAAQPAAAP
jgi:hypothetical protein